MLMCFNKQSVGTYGNTGFATVSMSCGIPPVLRLSDWVVARVGDVQNNRITESLHLRYSTVVYDEVLVSESRSTFGDHYLLIAGFHYLFCSEAHGKRGEELSFFNIYYLSCLCGAIRMSV